MNQFTIILPNERKSTFKWMTLLLAIVNLVSMQYLHLHAAPGSRIETVASICAASFVGSVLSALLFKKTRPILPAVLMVGIFFFSIGWLIMGYMWQGVGMSFLSILAWKSLQRIKVLFDEKGIHYPSVFYRKSLDWNKVENCMLRDNILTIDLKNNKLMQFTINESENPGLKQDEFNFFVGSHLL